ncbi:MAG TPA: hypothetical protein VN110_10205 [Sphingobium sp.]|nr:hypothetical protein [Sphingobium sp.]
MPVENEEVDILSAYLCRQDWLLQPAHRHRTAQERLMFPMIAAVIGDVVLWRRQHRPAGARGYDGKVIVDPRNASAMGGAGDQRHKIGAGRADQSHLWGGEGGDADQCGDGDDRHAGHRARAGEAIHAARPPAADQ